MNAERKPVFSTEEQIQHLMDMKQTLKKQAKAPHEFASIMRMTKIVGPDFMRDRPDLEIMLEFTDKATQSIESLGEVYLKKLEDKIDELLRKLATEKHPA